MVVEARGGRALPAIESQPQRGGRVVMATTDETTVAAERPHAYPPDAVLTPDEVAAWLGISGRQVYRLPIKRVALGPKTTRYLAKHVYEYLEGRAA